jgi:hypothetical protein
VTSYVIILVPASEEENAPRYSAILIEILKIPMLVLGHAI